MTLTIFGFIFGLVVGLISGLLYYGGNVIISHFTLRWMLSRQNILPFPRDKFFIAYLDNMCHHILLWRVGGGWVFIHRTLLEHFAAQHPNNNETISQKA